MGGPGDDFSNGHVGPDQLVGGAAPTAPSDQAVGGAAMGDSPRKDSHPTNRCW
jgi:hypothetical protein